MTSLFPGVKRKPALDENAFQQLLAAAYVLQQHNDTLRAKDPRLETSWVLSRVAETQSLLRAGGLQRSAAARLIADRLRTMTDAAGVSISLTSHGYLNCTAESGAVAQVPGSSIASHSLVATERLRNGGVFQSADAEKDIRLDTAACRELGIRALVAVPILRFGEVSGLVEARWSKLGAFHECDVRTCQLMAALITEMLEKEDGSEVGAIPPASGHPSLFLPLPLPLPLSESLGDEEAIPQLPEVEDATALPADRPAPAAARLDSEAPVDALAERCRVCDRPFQAEEVFCGNCGMPRVAAASSEDLQSKWASLWYMQQAQDALEERDAAPAMRVEAAPFEPPARIDFPRHENPKQAQLVGSHPERAPDSASPQEETGGAQFFDHHYSAGTPLSENTTRETLQRAFRTIRLRMRRRDAVLAMASVALLLILAVWSWWPAAPASSNLTWFESLLIELGLAEVPPRAPAVHLGNPDVRVWVDVHTALYYCPGSDLYGKTPGGQFTTQRDAQQDQFEPATGAVCD